MESSPNTEYWRLHWLEATGSLHSIKSLVTDAIEQARRAIAGQMALPALDIIIQPGSQVIPELGLLGRAWHSSLFSLTLDVNHPQLMPALTNGSLTRQVVHEAHHCMRMASVGYGYTLAEALISEGLAGQFVRHVLATGPELWENALPVNELEGWRPDDATLAASDYSHSDWFFGTGAYPRWLGYSLGYYLVGNWLAAAGEPSADGWITLPAHAVLSHRQ